MSLAKRLFGWAAMMVVIPVYLLLAIPVAMAWVTLKAIAREGGSVRVKLT